MSTSTHRPVRDAGAGQAHWFLSRNCSASPRQLGGMFISLCVVSLAIGTFFWLNGAHLVLPFVGLELLALGAAFVAHARHAADGERIFLQDNRLVVERETAGRLERAEFRREWVRIEPKTGDRSLILVSGQGRSMEVGRFVRPELRPWLAREIRKALRAG